MKTDKKETLDKYPAQRGILPTHAGFSGSKELDVYEMMRRKFFYLQTISSASNVLWYSCSRIRP